MDYNTDYNINIIRIQYIFKSFLRKSNICQYYL
nr:MAG TPA: hypothetical protein [Caudoviricetes sp.]